MNLFLSATNEPSFWAELWRAMKDRWFALDLNDYDNLGISSRQGLLSLRGIILAIFAGLVIAAGFSVFDKKRLGGLVRKIISEQAFTPETAQTVGQLGYDRSPAVKESLKKGVLSRVVHCVERDEYRQAYEEKRQAYVAEHGNDKDFFMPPYRIDFENDHFYIPDEEHYRAEVRYDHEGSGWRAFVLVILVAIACAAAVCFLLPDMLQLVDNMIGILSESDRVLID